MDNRVARALLEDNIMVRLSKDEGRLALLEKLATTKSVDLQTLPVPGGLITPGSVDANASYWQNVFLFDEFPGITWVAGDPGVAVVGQLGWASGNATEITLLGSSFVSPIEHYGMVQLKIASGSEGFITLGFMASLMMKWLQFVAAFDATIEAGDGIIFGLMDLGGTFEIDGTSIGIYFRHEHTETNWKAVTTDGVGTTETDTGIAFASATWFLFEIKQPTTGTIQFYINQILVATHTTNIDTSTGLYPLFGMKDPDDAMAFGVVLDYFAMQLNTIIQRWD